MLTLYVYFAELDDADANQICVVLMHGPSTSHFIHDAPSKHSK